MRFIDHYEIETVKITEASLGQLGKGFLRVGKNLFGKRVAGVSIDRLNSLNKFDRSAYNYVQGVLSTNFRKKNKTDEKIYIKNLYKGEIDDAAEKIGGYDNVKDNVKDISVYQTNRFGRIFLIHLAGNGPEEFYIGASWKGDSDFKDLFGVWPNALTSRLNRLMAKRDQKTGTKSTPSHDDDLEYALTNPADFLKGPLDVDVKKDEEEPEEKETKSSKLIYRKEDPPEKMGLIDINDSTMEFLITTLGKGGPKSKFTNQFKRREFSNNELEGYEYIFPGDIGSMFILDYKDKAQQSEDERALIVFSNKDSYKYASRIGLINFPYSTPGGLGGSDIRKLPVQWEYDADTQIFNQEI